MPIEMLPHAVPVMATVSRKQFRRVLGVTTANDGDAISAKADLINAEPFSQSTPGERVIADTGDGAGMLLWFATNQAADQTATFRVKLWNGIVWPGSGATTGSPPMRRDFITQFSPWELAIITVTAGTKTGVANGLISNSLQWADTITIDTERGYTNQVVVAQPSSADNAPVVLKVDCACQPWIEIERTAGTGDWYVIGQPITAQ